MLSEALHYEKLSEQRVKCRLCPHNCVIMPGKRGICGVRENQEGTLISLVYRNIAAVHLDPIEKKPLYHFLPGSNAFSVATQGCNLSCEFCQNHSLSLAVRHSDFVSGDYIEPERVVTLARDSSAESICFTYSEPTVYFETMLEIALRADREWMYSCIVSNGFIEEKPLAEIIPYIKAANIDLKCYSELKYRKYLKGSLSAVKRTIETLKRSGVWLEVTTLIVPGLSDDADELKGLTEFLVKIDRDIPWHVSRYHPVNDKFSDRPTPEDKILHALEIGKENGLRYIYAGNIGVSDYRNTICHNCREVLIERSGYQAVKSYVGVDGGCPGCREQVAGVFK